MAQTQTKVDIMSYVKDEGEYNFTVEAGAASDAVAVSDPSNAVTTSVVNDHLAYEDISENECMVTGIGGWDGFEVVIPAVYEGKDVVAIKSGAFSGNAKINMLTIEYGALRTIGANAFEGCTNLKEIYIHTNEWGGATLEEIQEGAFKNCSTFIGDNSVLPKGIEKIGDEAFYGCKFGSGDKYRNFLEFIPSASLMSLKTIGARAFANSGIAGAVYLDYALTIGEGAFANTKITHISIPSCIATVPESLCENCTNLISLNVQSTVIGSKAFKGCSALGAGTHPDILVTIGSNCRRIEKYAFAGCTGLQGIGSAACRFLVMDGWVAHDVYGNIDSDTLFIPLGFEGVDVFRLMAQTWYEKEFWRIDKIPAPSLALNGDELTITDSTGWADYFNLLLNGTKKTTVDAVKYYIEKGLYELRSTSLGVVSNEIYEYIPFTIGGVDRHDDYWFMAMSPGLADGSKDCHIYRYDGSLRSTLTASDLQTSGFSLNVLDKAPVSRVFYEWFNGSFRLKV